MRPEDYTHKHREDDIICIDVYIKSMWERNEKPTVFVAFSCTFSIAKPCARTGFVFSRVHANGRARSAVRNACDISICAVGYEKTKKQNKRMEEWKDIGPYNTH